MVYNKLELPDSTAEIQSSSPRPPNVIIEFNGSGIHKITGPTPQFTFSTSYNRSAVGQLDSVDRKITLEGQIVRSANPAFSFPVVPDQSGVKGLTGAHEALKSLFSECSAGTLAMYCDGTQFFEKHNVRVDSLEFNSSDNNFIQVAEFTVNLSFFEAGSHGYAVKNTTDEWNIEPLEDYVHQDFTITEADAGGELHNPSRNEIGGGRQNPTDNTDINFSTLPRYKISRKLAAAGLPNTGVGSGCTDVGVNTAYLEAKGWVESKLGTAFNGSTNDTSILNSGLPFFIDSPNYGNMTGTTFLYNHVRTTSFSISEGSYSVNETWLAMPTGVRFLENYDIDVSTDASFIKTVSVKGEVQGLYLREMNTLTGSNAIPTGNRIDIINDDITSSVLSEGSSSALTTASNRGELSKNKFENALSGYMDHVKPFLYQRANIGLNNRYYSEYWLDETTSQNAGNRGFGSGPASPNAPQIKNPIYVKEQPLNVIPTSTSEAHNVQKGSISYNFQYDNKSNICTGVLSSNVTVETSFPTDVFAEAFVLGRALGPVLQDLGTITSAKKTIGIEVKVIPPRDIDGYSMLNTSCPLYVEGNIYQTITGIANSLKPYGDQTTALGYKKNNINQKGQVYTSTDSENWNPIDGSYSVQLSYTYQPCNINQSFRT